MTYGRSRSLGDGGATGERSPNQSSLILEQPLVRFGREICGDLTAALRREWLVTNGLGGYASGTLSGINTRRYHGLLVAALEPPVGRTVLVGGTVERATYAGQTVGLSAHEYAGGTVDPPGYRHLQSFRLEGTLPVWTFAIADALLERRVWMAHGANTTYVSYRLIRASNELELSVTPLVTYRDFHALTSGNGWRPDVEARTRGVTVTAWPSAQPFRVIADSGEFAAGGDWYWGFLHREESTRGLDDRADLYAPGAFHVTLYPAEVLNLTMTAEDSDPEPPAASLTGERARLLSVLRTAGAEHLDPAIQQLILAADQFIVQRTDAGSSTGRTVIAGYHWFNDWGRDTMISLPGLMLATNRFDEAANVLRTFAGYISDGLLPNNFPDRSGVIPGYNTVDATLWYVLAIDAYHRATADERLVSDLLPAVQEIVKRHVEGTRFGIRVDPGDGLLRAGEPGVQLTWMDAKVGDWVVTPRIGKPVEINALWYNVLRVLAHFLAERDPPASSEIAAQADQMAGSFRSRFRTGQHAWLADVVDGPDGDDWTLRPNQIFAVSLPYPLLEGDDARAVVDAVSRALMTSYGLRSLSPDDPSYRGTYGGDQTSRDGGYHQGPVWSWLTGAFVDAHLRFYGDRSRALGWLLPFADHLTDAGLGSISEILEGAPAHLPRGCIAQAWSVAEVLRVWKTLTGNDGLESQVTLIGPGG